jgi:UDP-galactopyranose mutase
MEIPVDNGGYDYPMPFKKEQRLASEYYRMMPRNLFSIGRAGSYLYGIDIDDCIRQAMEVARQIKEDSYEYPVPCPEYRFPELHAS